MRESENALVNFVEHEVDAISSVIRVERTLTVGLIQRVAAVCGFAETVAAECAAVVGRIEGAVASWEDCYDTR